MSSNRIMQQALNNQWLWDRANVQAQRRGLFASAGAFCSAVCHDAHVSVSFLPE